MRYNFDEAVIQSESSVKWSAAEKMFGQEDIIPLWVADMDFKGPDPVIEALKRRAETGIYGYSFLPDSLYESVADWLLKRHQWPIEKEWICFSPGVVPALNACISAFTSPEDPVIIQTPVYPPFHNAVLENGRKLIFNPLQIKNNRYCMDFEDLTAKFISDRPKMVILCNPHNPVGSVWSAEELNELARLCAEHDVLLLSDEIHSDLVFHDYKHIPAASLSEQIASRSVTCIAPSKTFNMAGLQASFVIIPDKELRESFQQTMKRDHRTMANAFAVTAAEAAYRSGEDWLDQCLAYIRGNADYALRFLRERLPVFKPSNPEGTYLLWVDCRGLNMTTEELKAFMTGKAKVAVTDGSGFGAEGAGFIRMNLACRRSTLEEALSRLEQAVHSILAADNHL